MPEQLTTTQSLMATYQRFPLELAKGKESFVWDTDGNRYLDYTSGIATCNLGHVPDEVKEKVEHQLSQLWHCSNLYQIPQQEQLADILIQKSCLDQVFFCNSGAEANEAAIKLARKYSQKIKQQKAFEIVTFNQSFHGRSMATLSATGQEKIQDGFYPLVDGFRHLPFNNFEALNEVSNGRTCAVLLELIQGEGGVIPADIEWVQELARICQRNGLLLMVDEIQTGIGRTGTLFAYEQYGIEPDVITLAKGLGSGFPIGAMLAKTDAAKAFDPGSHGSTFGGNPLAATAGKATLETIQRYHLLESVQENSKYLKRKLDILKTKFHHSIVEIRGKGMLLGVVTKQDAITVVHEARKKKVLILSAGQNVVRILPPLTTDRAEIDSFLSVMEEIFDSLEKEGEDLWKKDI
ncbi:acetylornithine aminotransferase [Scopulibacillus darangshiensis]|uniref:Acetylornithine aminotransferase n=1 Tax=Scopulibacillus darangshiensis TaxID=442528 RepID=A0A4R2P275_9BACL|nr:acetylornithine transaminase [Scopulibacillus darangshiensis]TCP28722.1 acetylornithine aminotransferase [Scopulibacillus darangshiensis]